MTSAVRKTLRNGDKIIVTRNMTPEGLRNNTNLYGMVGVITDKKLESKSPKHVHSRFKVCFGEGIYRDCTAYGCEKIVEDADGFMKVLR